MARCTQGGCHGLLVGKEASGEGVQFTEILDGLLEHGTGLGSEDAFHWGGFQNLMGQKDSASGRVQHNNTR